MPCICPFLTENSGGTVDCKTPMVWPGRVCVTS